MSVLPARREDSAFSLHDVGVRYNSHWALRDIDLEVTGGERVALIGPSGSGKTTLLSLLNGMRTPTEGIVRLFGRDVSKTSPRDRRRIQRKIGTIHQQFDLVGPLRVIHNVNAAKLGEWGLSRAVLSLIAPRDVRQGRAALARVGIEDKIFERVDQLSGGQQQRVALARVLVQDPDAILADEPISSLDPARSTEVMGLLRELAMESSNTLVVSLHEYGYGLSHCDRVVGLREGRIFFDDRAENVTDEMVADLYKIESE